MYALAVPAYVAGRPAVFRDGSHRELPVREGGAAPAVSYPGGGGAA